jgi:hypothetical protein
MNDFLRLIGINIHWQSYLPFGNSELGLTPVLIVLAMCLVGTTIINSYVRFNSFFNTAINFSALFVGAYFANIMARAWHIPGIDGTIMIAVIANVGMGVAAICLLIYHRNSDA